MHYKSTTQFVSCQQKAPVTGAARIVSEVGN